MTESEWQACADPNPMLQELRGRVSDRKLRLFACACSRRIFHLLTDPRSRRAVLIAERAADGLVDEKKLKAAWGDARRSINQVSRATNRNMPPGFTSTAAPAEQDAWLAAAHSAYFAAAVLANAAGAPHGSEQWLSNFRTERSWQADLLRDLFPRRQLPVSPAVLGTDWAGGPARDMARTLYEERRFEELPYLADALEEAGCTNADVLGHLRGPGPHACGCWVLDLLLGRE
jgi:hypothetical protein